MTVPMNLSPEFCRQRQLRFEAELSSHNVELALFVSHENIQYLTGYRPHRLLRAALLYEAGQGWTLVAPNAIPENVTADDVLTFEAQWHATIRQEQIELAIAAGAEKKRFSASQRIGVEASVSTDFVHRLTDDRFREVVDLDAILWKLRRNKDPDELAMIGRAIDCTRAMYETARSIIEPGISELEVYNQLHATAVKVAGEPLTALGNDFQCGSPGGPPRDRIAQDGELYILDLGPAYRGYYADNCRTICVNGSPSDVQFEAWTKIVSVLELVEQTVRPGVSCRELYQSAKEQLDEYAPGAFSHHLGHGFGLFPHESPHLNLHWDDRFEEGDCFTAEPGLYTEELRAGIRLEQNYRVTATGVERLTDFPLDL